MNAAVTGSSSRILIVDDSVGNIALLRRLLARNGFTDVIATSDSSEATEMVHRHDPDLVLLDLHMPGVDGFEVLDSLRTTTTSRFLPVLVITGDTTQEARRRALGCGATDFLAKPLDVVEVELRMRNLLHMRELHRRLDAENDALDKRVKSRTRDLWQVVQDLERAHEDLRHAYAETVDRLSLAAEFRDDETAQHLHRMSRYCEVLARKLGLDDADVALIRVASVMHDVGKIGVADRILLKPSKLTPDEFEAMKKHAEYGYQILRGSSSTLLETAASIAFSHHERWDGTGYPRGLAGEDIPLFGRIAAIADVFDALSSDRVYRKAFPLPDVVRLMEADRGKHFDPHLLDVFLDSLDEVLRVTHPDLGEASRTAGISTFDQRRLETAV